MNYKELKIAVLQKMFSINGNTVEVDDTTSPYIKSIPQVANEGIDLIVQTGRPIRTAAVIHQVPVLPESEERIEGDAYGIVRSGGINRYDLQELIGPTFRKLDEQNIWYENPLGGYQTTRIFQVEAGRYLLLPADKEGLFRVYAICIPQSIALDTEPEDLFELPLPKECCDILPLYIASQLYKDDDISMATIWRNEFNIALEMMAAQEAQQSGGCGSFESITGWW